MLVVRPIQNSDIEPLYQLIGQAEKGLTTLKISRERLQQRIENSIRAFNNPSAKPAGQPYVFVMEDLATKKIAGTSAIYAKVGGYEPNYTYQIETKTKTSTELGIKSNFRVLHLKKEHDGPTEIGSLFLAREYWGQGLGRLLSLSRFFFMADFPQRFESEVIAEMRGVVDEKGQSALWTALGARFFQIDYPKADTMTSENKKFIADLMPEYPIYVALLPPEAQTVIGQVHTNTLPALEMLEHEGFEFRGFVDIFDGGPAVHCQTKNIRSIRASRKGTVHKLVDSVQEGPRLLISNSNIQFRCCVGHAQWNDHGQATIETALADALNLKVGDDLRTAHLKPVVTNIPKN